MERLHGWAPPGANVATIPTRSFENCDFVGGLTLDGFVEPMLLDGPIAGVWFLAWMIEALRAFLLNMSD